MLSQHAIDRATIVWRRRRYVGSAALSGLLLCASICYFLPRWYESTSRLMPADGIPELSILQSRAVQDALIDKFHLKKVYRERVIEDTRIDLQAHTTVSRNKRSGIVTIVVSDRSADRATAMDRDYGTELNRVVIAMAQKPAQADRIYFQQQLVRTSAEIKTAESSAAIFSSDAMVIDTADQLQTAIRREISLEGAINRRQLELQSMRVKYMDENPNVRAAKAQVSELNRELTEFIGKQVPAGTGQPPASLDVTTRSLREFPLVAARYDDLNRVVDGKERTALALNESYQSALRNETSDVAPVAVLDEPSVSPVRSWPLYFGIIFLGTCLSASLASAYAIIVHETSQASSSSLDGAAPAATPAPS
jgi:capsule polysaccharide export protein KpsE/RkpR